MGNSGDKCLISLTKSFSKKRRRTSAGWGDEWGGVKILPVPGRNYPPYPPRAGEELTQAGATDAAPLHHLISGYLLHHLKLAKAAACAFVKLPALVVQYADDVDAAQLVE